MGKLASTMSGIPCPPPANEVHFPSTGVWTSNAESVSASSSLRPRVLVWWSPGEEVVYD